MHAHATHAQVRTPIIHLPEKFHKDLCTPPPAGNADTSSQQCDYCDTLQVNPQGAVGP